MKSVRLSASLMFLLIFGWSVTASAQKIRNFGNDAEAQYGGGDSSASSAQTGSQLTYPGQPAPKQTGQADAQGQQAAQAQGDGSKQQPQGSYVTVFSPGGQTPPQVLNLPPEQKYRGVIPGTRDQLPMLDRARKKAESENKPNVITWIGFQPQDDATRIFFQTARSADYQIGRGEDGVLTVTFENSRIPLRNFARFIDTSFFNRNVTRLEAKQVDRSTVVVEIHLRESEQPQVDQSGDYLYLDFPYSTADAKSSQAHADAE